MRVTILDGYIDEPSRLGVPPFISPYVRYLFGAVRAAGHEPEYMTIDHYRQGARPSGDFMFMVSGALVPGKYLRTMPMSGRELEKILQDNEVESVIWHSSKPNNLTAGGKHIWGCDPDAYLFDLLSTAPAKRRRTQEEWAEWAVLGAEAVKQHHDYPAPIIVEIDLSYGCPHYISGGCSFCSEPLYGKPSFRGQQSAIAEIKALLEQGCVNFRLGGASCTFSYKAEGIEDSDPRPNVSALKQLFGGMARLDGIEVLHTDNADPSVIAGHPDEAERILKIITNACTSGNLLSLGVETADPSVAEANNLNSSAEDVLTAVRMINKAGAERGPTGLPVLLPGLNFLTGLEGETEETFEANRQFLEGIVSQGHLLRRINIRQVSPVRREFSPTGRRKDFIRFKQFVREEIDRPMLEKVVPLGTVLPGVHTEVKIGKVMFGRQIGTYPILVGIPDDIGPGHFIDVKATGHGSRSITALPHPLDINNCSLSALEGLPGIGRKRAIRIFRSRPIESREALAKSLKDSGSGEAESLAYRIVPYLDPGAFGPR